jgi:hypothetical protein
MPPRGDDLDAFTSSGNYLGTDRLRRRLTDAERNQLDKLLRDHGFRAASIHAFRFALKLAKTKGRAEDLIGRANLRLVRTGWDPNAVSLQRRLLRLVWSEFTHDKREEAAARRAEEAFLREEGIQGPVPPAAPTRGDPLRPPSKEAAAPSIEQQAIALEEDHAELAERRKSFEKLRARLLAKKDAVAIEYLDQQLKGTDDVGKIAKNAGRDVKLIYEAARRIHRMVEKILAEKNGVDDGDGENERGPR